MRIQFLTSRFSLASACLLVLAANVFAQSGGDDSVSSILWYVIPLGIILVSGVGYILWRMNSDKGKAASAGKSTFSFEWNPDPLDGDKGEKNGELPKGFPKAGKILRKGKAASNGIDFEEVKEKIEKIRFERLPISRFESMRSVKPFEALPVSDDDELLTAINEANDEVEESEEVREAALEVLTGFKNRNAIDAVAQMALYDLSSNIRSKAVAALADFDHESVFDTLLLACADPTREVRAAGARALFRLSFRRADAWMRLATCGDDYRIKQAAKAAIEADLVDRSIDRLVHEDKRIAEEALALLSLLVAADETGPLFKALYNHPQKNVKYGLLKVLELIGDEKIVPALQEFAADSANSPDINEAALKAIKTFKPVAA